LVFWIFLNYPVVASNKTVTLGLVISTAYPIMDMVLFIALMELLSESSIRLEDRPLSF
jgi:hypothetical protein